MLISCNFRKEILMVSYSHNTGTFIGKGGIEIFFQNWFVESPKGVLVIVHGLGEHSGRYGTIINELKGTGISIYALDQRGHGKSGGKRGHINSYMDYVDDIKLFIDIIQEENENIPLILLGHSMGGVTACKYALTYSEDLSGLILSSPGFVPTVALPGWKKSLVVLLSRYFPQTSLTTGLEPKDLSHDMDVVDAYENDHLVHNRISSRWSTEFIKSGEECLNRALELRLPLLVFHGKGDAIVDYHASETLFNNASSLNKELHLFEGLFHETMNEINYKKITQMVVRWIVKIAGTKKTAKHANKKTLKKPIKRLRKKAIKRK